MSKLKIFTISSALRFSWKATKKHLSFFIALFVIMLAIFAVETYVSGKMHLLGQGTKAYYLFLICNYIFFTLIVDRTVDLGVITASLDFSRERNTSFKKIISILYLLWRYALAYLIYTIMMFVGALFFIIPGAYLSLRYGFMPYLIIDQRLSVIEAFRQSSYIRRGYMWQIFWWEMILIIMNILAASPCAYVLWQIYQQTHQPPTLWQIFITLPLAIALIITFPITNIGKAYVYDQFYRKIYLKKLH